jgi:hypothetical protein
MDKAHKESRRTTVVLSPDYATSRFAATEWAARFAQDATSEHDLLIPIRVRQCELEGLLAQIVYVDLVGCAEAAARERLLKRVEGIRLKPDELPLFPGNASHQAVPERPWFPGAVRVTASWLKQLLLGGGVAAAIVGPLLTWWLGACCRIRAEAILHQNIAAFSGSGALYVDVRRQDFGLCNSLLGSEHTVSEQINNY